MVVKALLLSLVTGLASLLAIPLVFSGGDIETRQADCGIAAAPGSGRAHLDAIAATIRARESGDDYQARADGSTASGAYQFTDATWGGYGGYPSAWLAPPAVQDAKATEHITGLLAANNGDIAAVPVAWYLGYVPPPGDPAWDRVPTPAAGNRLTPSQYQAAWLDAYAQHAAPAPRCTGEALPDEGVPAGLSTVEGITVDTQIAPQVQDLVRAARASGYELTGTGHRSPDRQIELRRAHCGPTHYAIYEMPSSHCSPPTARPGQSMHERGLAIDFSCNGALIRDPSSACSRWLLDHAPAYDLHPLDSEPWHYSSNGR